MTTFLIILAVLAVLGGGYIAAVGLPDRYPRTVTALELACRGQLHTDRWRAHGWREPSALSQVGEAIVTITVGGST